MAAFGRLKPGCRGMSARFSTSRSSPVRPLGGVRRTFWRLCVASRLPRSDRDQNNHDPKKENGSQTQQGLRYQIGHQRPVNNLHYSMISKLFQLKHRQARVSVTIFHRAISRGSTDHGQLFADLAPERRHKAERLPQAGTGPAL